MANQELTTNLVEGRAAMPWVAGGDGCRAGWVVVLVQPTGGQEHHSRLCTYFAEVLSFFLDRR
jgi:predicted RNase H-like nuclease